MPDVIIATVREICRDTRMPAKSTAIAARCYMSRTTVWRRLKELIDAGQIERVGERRGYRPASMN